MEVPVPDHRFFVIRTYNPEEMLISDTPDSQRVGLLIKKVSGIKTDYSSLLQYDVKEGICHLSLRLFSTSEWPELIKAKNATVAIDLEYVLAHLASFDTYSADAQKIAIEAYREQTEFEFWRCYESTKTVGQCHRFLKVIKEKLTLAEQQFSPDFRHLKNGRLIEKFFRLSFKVRRARLLELISHVS